MTRGHSGGGLGLVACAVFKTVGRRLWRLRWVRFPHAPASVTSLVVAFGVLTLVTDGLRPIHAQIRIPVPTGQQEEDTTTVEPFRVRPPVSPLGGMFRSLLLPGWGQSVLERQLTGAVFVFWEGVTLTMTLKSAHQLSYLRRADDARPEEQRDQELLDAKQDEFEDWLVLLIFNHLFSAAEAFVAANLWDFPEEIGFRGLPGDRYGLGVTLTFP